MAQLSVQNSNVIIFVSYAVLLVSGLSLALKLRHQSKTEWHCANRTQTAIPLALNFIASALGSGILFSYPQLATIAGVQGVVTYAITSSAPLMVFAYLGPVIRKKCPDGFVLTEWARQRYGVTCSLYLSFLTLVTMFLYMVAELSALHQIMNALTGIDGMRFVIVECIITTVYTAFGGFRISFVTDNIQGAMVIGLSILFSRNIWLHTNKYDKVFIATVTIGFETKIDQRLVDSSGLTDSSLLGWQLLYILPMAVLTNDFFLSNFWIRTFASKTDEELWIGVSIATMTVMIILTLVGTTGLIACWTGAFDPSDPMLDGSIAFFYLLKQLPAWIIGMILVMVVTLSTAAFDSLQSAMISTASNDFFRNRINVWWVRLSVLIVMIPVVVIALKAPSILRIYLISDLISSSTIPLLVLGLMDSMDFLHGYDIVAGGVGGIFSVFIFGVIYYGNIRQGIRLTLLEEGLYANDWSVFGAFVSAPLGGVFWGLGSSCVRKGYRILMRKSKGSTTHCIE
ncbi:urea transport protein [Golovinomyces cichoracearum]|uniref:Urea transport protein n=1 Tax=Golovinomyces cichoracearum TaxID=62708 RepID=A0A420HHP3_9PEZI|nr:urea transport protein [Golovinomyces cichoracearum]